MQRAEGPSPRPQLNPQRRWLQNLPLPPWGSQCPPSHRAHNGGERANILHLNGRETRHQSLFVCFLFLPPLLYFFFGHRQQSLDNTAMFFVGWNEKCSSNALVNPRPAFFPGSVIRYNSDSRCALAPILLAWKLQWFGTPFQGVFFPFGSRALLPPPPSWPHCRL